MSIYYCHLRMYRRMLSLSQYQLAAELGVTRQTIYLIESGKVRPSLELAFAIADMLGEPIERIFVFRSAPDKRQEMMKAIDAMDRRQHSRRRDVLIDPDEGYDAWHLRYS